MVVLECASALQLVIPCLSISQNPVKAMPELQVSYEQHNTQSMHYIALQNDKTLVLIATWCEIFSCLFIYSSFAGSTSWNADRDAQASCQSFMVPIVLDGST